MLLPRVFASSLALAGASFRSAVTCSAMGSLPSPVLDGKGAAVKAEALAGKRVALYFSAGWCPMCTNFEPSLQTFLQASEDSGKPITIVYVPSDRSQEDAQARARRLNALSVPYEQADDLKKQFKVWAGSEALRLGAAAACPPWWCSAVMARNWPSFPRSRKACVRCRSGPSMTRAASGPELRWRSCAALPRRNSPTFETLWSSTRVMRMLSRSPNSESLYTYALRPTPRRTQNSLPLRRASGYGSLVGSVRARDSRRSKHGLRYSST